MQETVKMIKPFAFNGNFFIRTYLVLLIITIFMVVISTKRTSPPINTIFYQPLLKDKFNWKSTFHQLKKSHINTMVLQWSHYGVVDFMRNPQWLKTILNEARKEDIQIVIGLYADDKYFKKIEKKELNRSRYFQELKQKSIAQAKEIYTISKKYRNVVGWYIYEEIDDLHFQTPKEQQELKEYLTSLHKELLEISNYPCSISSFFAKHSSQQAYITMLHNVLGKNYKLFLQSGVGANLVNSKESSAYFKESQKILNNNITPIIEAFRFHKGKIESTSFKALEEQIKRIQKAYGDKPMALFSIRYFLSEPLVENYKEAFITPSK